MTLEQVENTGENTPNAEESTASKPAEEPSTEDKTPTLSETPDFIAALEKAQSGWDRRNQLLETRLTQEQTRAQEAVDKHTALMDDQAADNSLTSILKRYEDSGGDAESVDGLAKALKVANQTTTAANRKMEQATKIEQNVFLANKSLEFEKEYGIPKEELFGLESEGEMKIKGLEYQIANPKKPEKVKKVDSATGIGAGIDWRNLSPESKIKQALIK